MNVYEFDVFTASHDDVKDGRYDIVRSRVIVAATTYARAQDTAGALAVAVHGGMPTAIIPRV